MIRFRVRTLLLAVPGFGVGGDGLEKQREHVSLHLVGLAAVRGWPASAKGCLWRVMGRKPGVQIKHWHILWAKVGHLQVLEL